ncbi:MAG: hypothetical protein II809_06395, partial [Bacteroidales bacterium]|nr:hypothetical protein [Bacteroidales bacterium]
QGIFYADGLARIDPVAGGVECKGKRAVLGRYDSGRIRHRRLFALQFGQFPLQLRQTLLIFAAAYCE